MHFSILTDINVIITYMPCHPCVGILTIINPPPTRTVAPLDRMWMVDHPLVTVQQVPIQEQWLSAGQVATAAHPEDSNLGEGGAVDVGAEAGPLEEGGEEDTWAVDEAAEAGVKSMVGEDLVMVGEDLVLEEERVV